MRFALFLAASCVCGFAFGATILDDVGPVVAFINVLAAPVVLIGGGVLVVKFAAKAWRWLSGAG